MPINAAGSQGGKSESVVPVYHSEGGTLASRDPNMNGCSVAGGFFKRQLLPAVGCNMPSIRAVSANFT